MKLSPDSFLRKYIDMNVVTAWFVAILLFTSYQFYDAGWNFKFYEISCPTDAVGMCWNRVYSCDVERQLNPYECTRDIPAYMCPDNVCKSLYLMPGEHHGHVPDSVKYGHTVMFIITLLAFVVNHVLYEKRRSPDEKM